MNVLWTILENGAAVAAIEMSKVQNLIPDNGSEVSRYLKMGAMWTAADELLLTLRDKNQSNVLNGNYFAVADETFLNSVLVAASEKLGLVDTVLKVTTELPFGEKINSVVATGLVKFGSRVAIEYIPLDGVPYLQYLKHITALVHN